MSWDSFEYFVVFDSSSQKLKYWHQNFHFDKYADVHMSETTDLDTSTYDDKKLIFNHFKITNGTDEYDKVVSIKEELKEFFKPVTDSDIDYFNKHGFAIHPNYQSSKDPSGYKKLDVLQKEQFDKVHYNDTQIRFIQDYTFIQDEIIYSKWNFDFDKFSADKHIYGSKLAIFTTFVILQIYKSDTFVGSYGYGALKQELRQYFKTDYDTQKDLKDYIVKNGITSNYNSAISVKSLEQVVWKEYLYDNQLYMELPYDVSDDDIKEYYYREGQFERHNVPFKMNQKTPLEKIAESVCTVHGSGGSGLGFLYTTNEDDNKYLMTAYHIVQKGDDDIHLIYGTFEQTTKTGFINQTVAFRNIGHSKYEDIIVGIFDPDLEFNKNRNITIETISPLPIKFDTNVKKGDLVHTVGNLGTMETGSVFSGRVMETNFEGSFANRQIINIPNSIIIDIEILPGMSGAPVFQITEDGQTQCVGMINASISNKYTQAQGSLSLSVVSNNIILLYQAYKNILGPIELKELIRTGFPKKWLGINFSYFHPQKSIQYHNALTNFPYTGGILIHDFVVGFDPVKKMLVYSAEKKSELFVQSIETIFLNTQMYVDFLDNGKAPIVLKSITMFDSLKGDFNQYYLGKYAGQSPYSIIQYGFSPVGYITTLDTNKYDRSYIALYNGFWVTYYYFNSVDWVEKTIYIAANDNGDINDSSSTSSDISDIGNNTEIVFFGKSKSKLTSKLNIPSYLDKYLGVYNFDNSSVSAVNKNIKLDRAEVRDKDPGRVTKCIGSIQNPP